MLDLAVLFFYAAAMAAYDLALGGVAVSARADRSCRPAVCRSAPRGCRPASRPGPRPARGVRQSARSDRSRRSSRPGSSRTPFLAGPDITPRPSARLSSSTVRPPCLGVVPPLLAALGNAGDSGDRSPAGDARRDVGRRFGGVPNAGGELLPADRPTSSRSGRSSSRSRPISPGSATSSLIRGGSAHGGGRARRYRIRRGPGTARRCDRAMRCHFRLQSERAAADRGFQSRPFVPASASRWSAARAAANRQSAD